MKLYRILVDCRGAYTTSRFDVIVLAFDPKNARELALQYLAGTGVRRRVVKDSLVEIVQDHARVIASETVTW